MVFWKVSAAPQHQRPFMAPVKSVAASKSSEALGLGLRSCYAGPIIRNILKYVSFSLEKVKVGNPKGSHFRQGTLAGCIWTILKSVAVCL